MGVGGWVWGGWGGLQRSEKLAERRAAEEAFTWDVTLGRPIQHCEGHNRQGWPRTYTHTHIRTRTTTWPEHRGALILSHPLPPLYEYQSGVYLRTSLSQRVISKPACVGTAHYFPDRCMRDGYRVELQQEMCHLSAAVTERSI